MTIVIGSGNLATRVPSVLSIATDGVESIPTREAVVGDAKCPGRYRGDFPTSSEIHQCTGSSGSVLGRPGRGVEI